MNEVVYTGINQESFHEKKRSMLVSNGDLTIKNKFLKIFVRCIAIYGVKVDNRKQNGKEIEAFEIWFFREY